MQRTIAGIGASLLLLAPGHTLGQDKPVVATAETANYALEEVIVTANRRQENIQEVPMSVTAFTEDFIKDSGITNLTSLEQYTPSLKIVPGSDSRSTSIRIRGIGSSGGNSGIDPSVGVFIDGVYQGRAGMSIGDLLDIERVEILRGPQGTLYGKNTAAGAIVIHSRKPGAEFEGEAEVVVGNYNAREFRGTVGIPFGNNGHGARLSGYSVLRDGWDDNAHTGKEINDADKWGLKLRTIFEMNDAGSLLITVDRSVEDTNCCASDIISYDGPSMLNIPFSRVGNENNTLPINPLIEDPIAAAPLNGQLPPVDVFDRKIYTDAAFSNNVEIEGIAGEWSMQLDNEHSLTWISAYRDYQSFSEFDGDFSSFDTVKANTDVDFSQVSHEFRVASPAGEQIEYQAGLYYFYSEMNTYGFKSMEADLVRNFLKDTILSLTPGTHNIDDNTHETTSYAAFGQLTWNISEQWSLTGGLRYTDETKERTGTQISSPDQVIEINAPPLMGPDIRYDEEQSNEDVSPMLSLRWFAMEDLMVYASIARGFKSGGFNQIRTTVASEDPDNPLSPPIRDSDGFATPLNTEFDEEISNTYEIGFKSTWMERRLQVNATVFFVDYEDFQAETFNGTDISVRNAGNLESYGVEMDGMFMLTPNLMLGMAVGYNKAEYKDFDEAECTVPEAVAYANEHPELLIPFAPFPGAALCPKDLAGEPLANAPEWTVSLFAQYTRILTDSLKGFSRLEYSYTDEFFLAQDLDPNLVNDSSVLVNARLGIADISDTWEVALWGRNLFDEDYLVAGFDVPTLSGYSGFTAPPRTYGASLRYRF